MRMEIKGILVKLYKIHADVTKYLVSAEDAEAGDRIEKLENELECIEEAINKLEEIE